MGDRNQEFYNAIPETMPRTPPGIVSNLFRWIFNLMRWRFLGQIPQHAKAVVILVPHTSNWDFFIAIVAKFSLRLRASYMMKREAFFWPFKNWLIKVGGIPVNRSQPATVVNQVSDAFRKPQGNWLVITPEGTRKKVDRFKTGFVRIAHTAKVPIIVVGFDYQQKAIIFAKEVWPSGNHDQDADELYNYCRTTFIGKRPENQ